jgi:DNA gyrase/topoisomerase IV subunit B
MEKTNNRDFKVLNDREHVLQRSGMYIGGTKLVTQEQWIIDQESGKIVNKSI